jgi:threonine/homoserine/homoserine lactone efflux protein
MDYDFWWRGFAVGFSIAAPVGPIGVLCIRRTLAEGRLAGLVSGLGAATADGFYGAVAGFGLTVVSDLLVGHQVWLRLIGGAFLLYLGFKTFFLRPANQPAEIKASKLITAYFATFLLTLTNPMTIFSFAAIFAGVGLGNSNDPVSASALVLGVFMGSAFWWLLLSLGVSSFRSHFNAGRLRWINRISGLLITGFGLLALLSLRK